jgi:hypothetical protein
MRLGNVEMHGHRNSVQMVLPEALAASLRQKGSLFSGNLNNGGQLHREHGNQKRDLTSFTSSDARHVMEILEDYPTAVQQYTATYRFGARVIIYQCLAYTAAFFLVWLFPSVNRIVQYRKDTNYFGLLLLQCFFEPLQGLFNVFVYRYAHFLRLQARYPHMRVWDLVRYTGRWSCLGPPLGLNDEKGIDLSMAQNSNLSQPGNSPLAAISSDLAGEASEASMLSDAALCGAQIHLHSMMGELMMDYADNPSLLNQKMVTVATDYGFLDDEPPAPSSYPNIASMTEFPAVKEALDNSWEQNPELRSQLGPVMTEFPRFCSDNMHVVLPSAGLEDQPSNL